MWPDIEFYCQTWDLRADTFSIQVYFIQTPNVKFTSEDLWKDEWKDNVTITIQRTKRHDVDKEFGFLQYRYILREQANQWLFCEFIHPGRIFSFEKCQSMFGWRGRLSLVKILVAWSFFSSFMTCDNILPFLILYEKYRISSCPFLTDKNHRRSHVPSNGPID